MLVAVAMVVLLFLMLLLLLSINTVGIQTGKEKRRG